MIPTNGLSAAYGVSALLIVLSLAIIIRGQYKRLRRLQPASGEADPLAPQAPIEFGFTNKRSDRVSSALRAWSSERAEADLVVVPRAPEPEPAAAPEPVPAVHPKRIERHKNPVVDGPFPTRFVEWEPGQEPASEPTPNPAEAESKSEPASSQTEWKSEPVASSQTERKSEPAFSQTEWKSEPSSNQTEWTDEPFAKHAEEPVNDRRGAQDERFKPPQVPLSQNADYYEVLQISPNADAETIHRVYRIMAVRFHPDNPTTGSLERFLVLREAYQTLSDPELRAEYDASRPNWQAETMPIFWQKSFVDGIEGETNRRLGVLSLLYQRRRINESKPGISVMELEKRMAFPREYLNFTLWYLRQKGYVAVMQDNSDYALTSTGVDYVESGSNTNKVIRELLTPGTGMENEQLRRRNVVVQFPRKAIRGRTESSRRILRRKQAGGRR